MARTRDQPARHKAVAPAPPVDRWDRARAASVWDMLAANVAALDHLAARPLHVEYYPENDIVYLGVGSAESPVAHELASGVVVYCDPETLLLASLEVLDAHRQAAAGGLVRDLVEHVAQFGNVPVTLVPHLGEPRPPRPAPLAGVLADLIRLAATTEAADRRRRSRRGTLREPQGP